MSKPLILKWYGYTFCFAIVGVTSEVKGKVKLLKTGNTLQMTVKVNNAYEIPLGTLEGYKERDTSNSVVLSISNTPRNIYFKYLDIKVDVAREFPTHIESHNTAFVIIFVGKAVRCVLIMDSRK